MSHDIPILEGQEFREFWEEHLTPEARQLVEHSVAKGVPLDDLGLASAAVSLARKELQLPKIGTALLLAAWAASITFLVWLFSLPPHSNILLPRILAAIWVLILPARLFLWLFVGRPRAKRAEVANVQRLLDSKSPRVAH